MTVETDELLTLGDRALDAFKAAKEKSAALRAEEAAEALANTRVRAMFVLKERLGIDQPESAWNPLYAGNEGTSFHDYVPLGTKIDGLVIAYSRRRRPGGFSADEELHLVRPCPLDGCSELLFSSWAIDDLADLGRILDGNQFPDDCGDHEQEAPPEPHPADQLDGMATCTSGERELLDAFHAFVSEAVLAR